MPKCDQCGDLVLQQDLRTVQISDLINQEWCFICHDDLIEVILDHDFDGFDSATRASSKTDDDTESSILQVLSEPESPSWISNRVDVGLEQTQEILDDLADRNCIERYTTEAGTLLYSRCQDDK